jgi:hypothetical protein
MNLPFPHMFSWLGSSFIFGAEFHCWEAAKNVFHSPSEEHLDYFRVWTIMNKAAVNILFLCGRKFST